MKNEIFICIIKVLVIQSLTKSTQHNVNYQTDSKRVKKYVTYLSFCCQHNLSTKASEVAHV